MCWVGVDVCALARLSTASEDEGQHVHDSRAARAGALQGTGLRVVATMSDHSHTITDPSKAQERQEARMVG